MSKIIENPKSYTGQELETIFFRPMLTGADALNLGIRVLYNMPVPNTLNFWHRSGDALQKYAKGWDGGDGATQYQKTISLNKVKAELGFAAEDYFQTVWEKITNGANVNLDDLTGTEIMTAETDLFRSSIAESIRATMWVGDTTRTTGGFNSFDGFVKNIKGQLAAAAGTTDDDEIAQVTMTDLDDADAAISLFESMWSAASDVLRASKDEGNLAFFVTSDIYENYEASLEGKNLESAFGALQNGRSELKWHGIAIVNTGVGSYLKALADMPNSFAILTDRRNLALAVNTSDFPGTEARMWYNPDEMENRQRAIFMAGTELLLPELCVASFKAKPVVDNTNND